MEDISLDFSFAQSVLFKIFGGVIQETGHKTRGHVSLTDQDRCGRGPLTDQGQEARSHKCG